MKFKVGDRVHVTRLDGKEVDFYATLGDFDSRTKVIGLVNCTNESSEGVVVYLPNDEDFGPDKEDYYILATDEDKYLRWSDGSTAEGKVIIADEEDTEEPDRQSITKAYNKARLKNYEAIEIMQDAPDDKIELDNHYIIEVKEGLYVALVTSNGYLKLTKDINKADVYEYKNAALKHAEFVDGRVLNLKRYVEVE